MKALQDEEPTFMLAVETPKYWNFIVHRKCYLKSDEETLKSAVKVAFFGEKEYNLYD